MGLNVNTGDVFKSLGSSLPGWVVPGVSDDPGRAAALPASPAVEAMRRIVTETEDPAEGGRRFQELVRSAIDRFNEGSLAQAGTMIDLANQIISDRKIDPVAAQMIRKKDDDSLDPDRLRKYAEAADLHPQLRKVLNFFLALTPEGLLGDLKREVKRERRRLLLLLLEVHGVPAREAALAELRPMFGRGTADEDWYFRRNLLYLLRRIPRPPGTPIDEDVDLAVRHTELRFPAPLVKEAIANLGQLKHEKAEHTLIALLQDLETVLLGKPDETPYDPREGRLLLDRVVAALARFGTPGARRAVIEHGLKRKPELGDTMARLAELAGQDLSADGESLDRLLAAMKSSAPFKLFGLVLNPNDQGLFSCIEAISCTPAPQVRSALEELARRFSNHEVGKAAAKALANLAAPPTPMEQASSSSSSSAGDAFGRPRHLRSPGASSEPRGIARDRIRAPPRPQGRDLRHDRSSNREAQGLPDRTAFRRGGLLSALRAARSRNVSLLAPARSGGGRQRIREIAGNPSALARGDAAIRRASAGRRAGPRRDRAQGERGQADGAGG